MEQITVVYDRYRKWIERFLFPACLIVYPLLRIGQGIEVSDTTYSLSNFQYFHSMDGTWMVATYLANVVGNLMMRLPFGGTLRGMYFYTALVQSATGVTVYEVLRKKMPAPLVFVGEWLALGLCWCPSTVLYNYLTYLLMTAGALLLYEGILRDDRRYEVAAGFCLGMNVAVRMPNVVQAALILALWYGAAIDRRTLRRTVQDTLWCVLGYLAGFGVFFAAICIRYGVGAYPAMLHNIFAMTEKAEDYKPAAMITGTLGDYGIGIRYLLAAAVCMAGGWLLFALRRRFFPDMRAGKAVCRILYALVLCVLLRFYWGRGMFSFRYYSDGSVYYSAALFLTVTIGAALYSLFGKKIAKEQKIMAVIVLVQIMVTPLGSNNHLYPIINNLFLAAPFLLWFCYERSRNGGEEKEGFLWKMPFVLLTGLVLVQSTGFHLKYAFRDGDQGEKRDTQVSAPVKAAGVDTNQDNAAWLEELAQYVQDAGLTGREVILYGDVPGLGYLLDMPSALSTFWADLDSYRMVEFEQDMEYTEQLTTPPVFIVSAPTAAYLNEDADGMNWFGVNEKELDADEKLQILAEYMETHSYREDFGNGRYVVYVTEP